MPEGRVIPKSLIGVARSYLHPSEEPGIEEVMQEVRDVLKILTEGLQQAEEPDYLKIPRDFRIIGTINTFDRTLLRSMVFALLRCFSHIFIEPQQTKKTSRGRGRRP